MQLRNRAVGTRAAAVVVSGAVVSGVFVAALAGGVAGCHSGRETAPVGPGGGFTITERAESAPITALAVKPPFLWAAGSAGLRRFDLAGGESEAVGEANDARTRGITAIAVDDEGGTWVASAAGLGRWVAAGDDLRYEPKGTPGAVNVIAPRRPVATEGIWAGGPGGLYRYDGRIFPSIDGIREVAVSSIVLDDDGKGAWVGTLKNGVYHAEGDHAAPVPGGEAIFLDAVLGIAKTAAGTRLVAGNAGTRTAVLRADEGRRRRVSRPARAGGRRAGRSRRRRGADRRPAGQATGLHAAAAGARRGVPGGQPQVRVAGTRAHRPLGGDPHAGPAAS